MVTDMASIVKSGSSNPTYTNTTGKNVRLKFNFLQNPTSVSWGVSGDVANLTVSASSPAPSEILLAPNHVFAANCGAYNYVIIKEDGS